MNITIGFIAIFISIVIPGLLFLRIYFFGEFSKQFTTKEPVVRSLIYSIIPGLIIQFIGLISYAYWYNGKFSLSKKIGVYKNLLSDESLTKETVGFLDKGLPEFGVYSICVLALTIFLGYFSSRLVRLAGFDRRYKLFRYKNLWCYIFRGEILGFKKFKQAITVLNRPDLNQRNVDMVFADVLVDSSEGTQIYTGFVVDYDLSSTDVNQLERIYLFDANRYKKTKIADINSLSGIKTVVSKKPIPGSVFILPVDKLVNINLLYVTSEKEKVRETLWGLKKKLVYIVLGLIFLLFMVAMTYYFFVKASWYNGNWYVQYFANTGWFDKIVGGSLYIQILGLFMPKQGKEIGEFIFFHDMKAKLGVFAILIVVFLVLNYSWVFN